MTDACDKRLDLVVLNGLFHTERVGCNLFVFLKKFTEIQSQGLKTKEKRRLEADRRGALSAWPLRVGFPAAGRSLTRQRVHLGLSQGPPAAAACGPGPMRS